MNKQTLVYPVIIIILLIALMTQMFYSNSSVITVKYKNKPVSGSKEEEDNEVDSLENLIIDFVELEPDRYINDYNAFSDKEEVYQLLEQEYLNQVTDSIDYNKYYIEGSFKIDEDAERYITIMANRYKVSISVIQNYLDIIYGEPGVHEDGSEGLGYFRLNSVNIPIYKVLIEEFDVNNFKHNTQAFILHCLKLKKEGKLSTNQAVKEIGLGKY